MLISSLINYSMINFKYIYIYDDDDDDDDDIIFTYMHLILNNDIA